jgi:hypothetical protein
MTPDFEQVKTLFRTIQNVDIPERQAERIEKTLAAILPRRLYEKLEDIIFNDALTQVDVNGAEFENAFRDYYRKPMAESSSITDDILTGRVDTDEEPDEYIQDSEFPDYATNWDGTVISLGGPRKKKGKRMRPFPDWAKTHSGRWYPTSYFTITKDGQSHRQTQAQMLMRRRKALQARKAV